MLTFILFFAVIICLIFVTIYRFKIIKKSNGQSSFFKWFSALLPLLLLVLVFKSGFIGSFKVTTPSMLGALEVGDRVLVNKMSYGISLPFSQNKKIATRNPKRGDVIAFYWSQEDKTLQLKRIIGLPGDKVAWLGKELVLNDAIIPNRYYGDYEAPNDETVFLVFNEDIPTGDKGDFAYSTMILEYDHYQETQGNATWNVPQGHYFVLGDNRDNSVDSRTNGFVPASNIIGQAQNVWFHWNSGNGFDIANLLRITKPVTYSLAEAVYEEEEEFIPDEETQKTLADEGTQDILNSLLETKETLDGEETQELLESQENSTDADE